MAVGTRRTIPVDSSSIASTMVRIATSRLKQKKNCRHTKKNCCWNTMPAVIMVGMGTCGLANGAQAVYDNCAKN
jgi:hypothetical protein